MSRSSLFKPALLAGLFACAGLASQASATDWSPIHIMPDEEFYQYRDSLSANAGQVLRYRFSTPAAATQVRVELTGANGNGNLKVFRDSENAVPACDSRQPGSNEVCTVAPAANTPAATWFVEVSASTAFSNAKLVVAYLPKLVPVNDLPDLPYTLAQRPTFHTSPWEESNCLQVRTGAPGFPLPAMPCMPVGGQQVWDFQKRPKHYRIVNPLTKRCLAGDADSAWVQDRECNELDYEQAWTVLGISGTRHFIVLRHDATGKCATFNDDPHVTSLVACNIGGADTPGWALREVDERVFPAMAHDGATFSLIAGVLCIGDAANGPVLTPCDDRSATRRDMGPTMVDAAGKMDVFSDNFLMTTADKNRCLAVDPGAGSIVFRECALVDVAQQWTIELYGTKSSEWQLRSVQQQKCLTTQGATTAGTPLVLADCEIGDTKMRWRYVGL
jgi:hypothetical protein